MVRVNNDFEVKFTVTLDVSLFFPNDGNEKPDNEWLLEFIQNLGVALPDDTPENVYLLTQVKKAVCVKFGKAEIK